MGLLLIDTAKYILGISPAKGIIICAIASVFLLLFFCVVKIRTKKGIQIFSVFLFVIIAACTFVLYFLGYVKDSENGIFVSSLRAIFSTGRTFLINDDYSLIENNIIDGSVLDSFWFTASFWAAHVAALFWFVLSIINVFGRRLIERIILLLRPEKNIYVICGANARSLCLADSLLSKKKRLVIVIDENASDSIAEKIQNLGAILIRDRIFENGVVKHRILKKTGLLDRWFTKKVWLFLFEDDETYNISIARSILMEANKHGVDEESLSLYIETSDKNILNEIDETMKYDVNTISEADLAVRQLMEEFPIVNTLDIDPDLSVVKNNSFSMMIIGFGKIGREVLLSSLRNGQFVTSDKKPLAFNAIVVDSKWSLKSWQFKNMYPALKSEYPGIQYRSIDVYSDEFEKVLCEKIEELNYIVIATDKDQKNFQLAKDIQNYMERRNISMGKKVIAVHMRNQSNLLNKNDENGIYRNIKFFGECSNIYNEDVIINETMDLMAKDIYDHYNIAHGLSGKWTNESLFVKDSNRSAAMHIKTKLKLMGYAFDKTLEQSEMKGDSSLERYLNSEKSKDQLDNLLRTEHLRWNAFHFTNGWVTFPALDEDEERKRQTEILNGKCGKLYYKERKNLRKKWHSCLVSWEDLPYVSDIFCYNKLCSDKDLRSSYPHCPEDNRNKLLQYKYPEIKDYQLEDLEQLLGIPEFLDYSGIKVRKTD